MMACRAVGFPSVTGCDTHMAEAHALGTIRKRSDPVTGEQEAVMRTATVSTDSVDALLEAWAEATCTLSHLRALALGRIKVEPDDELAAFVLILTAED